MKYDNLEGRTPNFSLGGHENPQLNSKEVVWIEDLYSKQSTLATILRYADGTTELVSHGSSDIGDVVHRVIIQGDEITDLGDLVPGSIKIGKMKIVKRDVTESQKNIADGKNK
jgi:hypothetical protein